MDGIGQRNGYSAGGEVTVYYKLFLLIIIACIRECAGHRQSYKEKIATPVSQMKKLSFR